MAARRSGTGIETRSGGRVDRRLTRNTMFWCRPERRHISFSVGPGHVEAFLRHYGRLVPAIHVFLAEVPQEDGGNRNDPHPLPTLPRLRGRVGRGIVDEERAMRSHRRCREPDSFVTN